MFSKRHYENVAKVLFTRKDELIHALNRTDKDAKERRTGITLRILEVDTLIGDFALMFGKDNERFDRSKFLAASGLWLNINAPSEDEQLKTFAHVATLKKEK